MNKRMIVLIALVVAVSAVPASAETLEVRGTIEELEAAPDNLLTISNPDAPANEQGRIWDYSSFAGFWYDLEDNLETETLTILATVPSGETNAGDPTLNYDGDDRTIDESALIYRTAPEFQEYELHQDVAPTTTERATQNRMEEQYDGDGVNDAPGAGDRLDLDIGLCVDSGNPGGDCGYFLEGWMGKKYVALDNNADELCKLLVEFEDDDTKTLATGEEWDLGGGFALVANQIDLEGDKVWFLLKKDDKELDNEVTSTGESTAKQDRVYTYTADIGNEEDIPVFSCYVDAVYRENDTNVVQVMYVFLIDDDVLEIDTSETYGAMEVMTASASGIVLKNDETTIDLNTDTKEPIMGNMYFVTADDDCAIRFYPMVEYTEPGTYEVRGTIAELDGVTPTLGVDRVWDYSTFAGFWYDLDDNLEMESLTILSSSMTGQPTLDFGTGDRTIDENTLIYRTAPVFQEYELHANEPDPDRTAQTAMEEAYDGDGIGDKPGAGDRLDMDMGLCVESDNPGGDCGYFIEAWMAEEYVAIDANADKLCKLLVEFEDDDKKILYIGEKWNISGGFALELVDIDDVTGDKATLRLSKNGNPLDTTCIDTGGIRQDRVYTYTVDIGTEEDIPVFSYYVDAVFKGDISYVQLMYVFLIDDDVLEIDTSDQYGIMEVKTVSSSEIVLTNDGTPIDLDPGTTEHTMGDMYFKTADDETAIRFYPFVERTIGGEEPTPPPETIPAADSDHDGVPDVWDADNSTQEGYLVNPQGIGRMLGDMNGDGRLTSADALMILQATVGKIDL